MKILGLEIKRATKTESFAAKKTVTVSPSTSATKPTIPLKSAFPRVQLGDSGTRMMSGVITEEYNPQLQGIQGIRVFDEMRKSDGTVQAAVKACTLPVQRAKWFIEGATQDAKDIEIKNFVEHALFDWIEDMTWDDVVRQALLKLVFGVMPFEKVYGIKEYEGKTYVIISKLAPRLPRSIQQWELSDGTFGIQQVRQDGVLAEIPGSKLLIFVNDKEGDNWWGTSMLRSAYKHWYFKNNFYQIDAMAFERQGMGLPMIKMPTGYTETDAKLAATAARNLRANEEGYLLLPPGYDAEMMNMGASSTRDPKESINHHNKEILQSCLTQFMDLGSTSSGSGSHALSADHSELFLKGEEAIAASIAAEINKKLIPELVNLNFPDVKVYPKICVSGITRKDVAALATAYKTLTESGAMKPVPADEAYMRAMMELPQVTEEDMAQREEDEAEDMMEVEEAPAEKPGAKKKNIKDDDEIDTETDPKNKAKDKKVDSEIKKASEHVHGPHCKHNTLKKKFSDSKGFMTWRPQTFAEKKVSFDKIEKTMDEMEAKFENAANSLLREAKESYMKKLAKALVDGDTVAVKALEVKFVAEYKALLKDTMKSAYEYGKNNASTEMGVPVPANSAAALANIELMADAIANKTAVDIETKAKIAAANVLKTGVNSIQAAATVDDLLDDAVDAAVINTKGLVVNQSINDGRLHVFEKNADKIYAIQRSELLDKTTCNFCLSVDGRVITLDDPFAKYNSFHSNCRGIWVEILKDEENPPEIGEIPENLADYYGGQPNELVQPPRVMPAPGTLAEEYVKSKKK